MYVFPLSYVIMSFVVMLMRVMQDVSPPVTETNPPINNISRYVIWFFVVCIFRVIFIYAYINILKNYIYKNIYTNIHILKKYTFIEKTYITKIYIHIYEQTRNNKTRIHKEYTDVV
jgi:hypothetical protein